MNLRNTLATLRRSLLLAGAVALLASCGTTDGDTTPTTCKVGEHKCVDGKLAACGDDGTFGTPVACKAPMECHALDGKIDHCMVFADGMSHDGMMHTDGMTHDSMTHDGMMHGDAVTKHDGMAMAGDTTATHDAGK